MSHFDKYVNMIRKRSHEYAYKYNMDYEDVEAQGFLIYCECLDTFDVTKSSFQTHLYTELGRLDHYCYSVSKHREHRVWKYDEEGENVSLDDVSDNNLPSLGDILETAIYSLSDLSYKVLEWMLKRTWEHEGRNKPTIKDACSFFKVSYSKMKNVWDEIGNFYRNELIY